MGPRQLCVLAAVLSAVSCYAAQSDCPKFCTLLYAPVCGSDGVSYGNICKMHAVSCRTGKKIEFVHAGSCGKDGGLEAVPVASRHRRQCPQGCVEIYKPVCASNGKTYPNECEMNRAACRTGMLLKIRSYDECEAAGTTPATTLPPKDCNFACLTIYDPVCASDGNTYGNECAMNRTACELGKPLTIVSHGACPVENTTGSKPATTLPPKDCNFACLTIYDPVCASDGNTYGNECFMNSAACKLGKPLTVVSHGRCPVSDSTGSTLATTVPPKDCNFGCIDIYDPVCASDGNTYGNECVMNRTACELGKPLTIVSHGACPVENTTGSTPATTFPPKDCNFACLTIYDPVCASDGNTYGNECFMNSAACKLGKPLTVVSHGRCPVSDTTGSTPATTVPPKDCNFGCIDIYDPVCASDGNTYGNECEMNYAACTSGKPIEVVYQGECGEEARRASANCPTACIALYAPVCGSDGQTYSNECVMRASACQKGVSLTVASRGECPMVTATCKVVPCPKI